MADSRFLLIGLGNPGPDYHLSRHNIGFYFLDHFASAVGARIDTPKMHGLFCQGRVCGKQVLYLKPQTYMNRSGECVRSFTDYFKIPIEQILVVHDDIDLEPGRIKVVGKGGAGGHNGIRSLIQHLGSSEFARMKIGVGRPQTNAQGQGQPVDQFVLSRMSVEELRLFDQRKAVAEQAVEVFVREGIGRCMNHINGR